MGDDSGKAPDIWEEAQKWIYAEYGLRGLAILGLAWATFYVWRHWEDVKKWPGIAWLIEQFKRKPVPKADPARFSVMVARLADDEQGEYAKLITALLAEFDGVQILELDRTIKINDAGHQAARGFLEKSGASILIWGRVLRLDGKTIPQLNISTSGGLSRRLKQYAVEAAAEFTLPKLFWKDLAEVIRLQIISSAEEFSNPGKYVADRLPQQIERVRHLLTASADRQEWDADARASVHVILAVALGTLGEQTGQNLPLEQSVDLINNALQIWTRDRTPLHWAMTQNNLGVALSRLGKQEIGTVRIKQGIDAFNYALQGLTRDGSPLEWARIQNNLVVALAVLGERESDPAYLEDAILAYKNALMEFTQEKFPQYWANTQMNLGGALAAIAQREIGTTRLEEAVVALKMVLQEWTREWTPLHWAGTQINLGSALVMMGERERDPARLRQGIAAYNQALLEFTIEKVPSNWAMTQRNLGGALTTLGLMENDPARIIQSIAAFDEALKVCTCEDTPLDWAAVQNNLGGAFLALGRWEIGIANLKKAVAAFNNALEVYRTSGATYLIGVTEGNLAHASAIINYRQGN